MNVLKVSYRDPEAKKKFHQSLKETGFAVLTDHPISPSLIFDTYQDWERFFSSPSKNDYRFDAQKQDGYFPFRSENAKDYSKKDLKEFYHVYKWGRFPNGLSENTWKLFKELSSLGEILLGWTEESLPPEIASKLSMPLSQMSENSSETLLRILHYPPLEGTEEQGAIRAAAHEDINLITLLPSATAPGLEVLDNSGNWHKVDCNPGQIVINSGDMLKMATQSYYGSTTHRVVNPTGEQARTSRYSMPLFLHPRFDVKLSGQHTAGTYLKQRLAEIGLKKSS